MSARTDDHAATEPLTAFERALARFHVGQRVTLSPTGLAAGLQGQARTPNGRVTSFRGGWLVVQRDGIQNPARYDPRFWKAR